MSAFVPLSELPLSVCGTVTALSPSCPIRRRLLDIGFHTGEKVRPLYRGPGGSPTAYAVRGAVIALRAKDAVHVLVAPSGNEALCHV